MNLRNENIGIATGIAIMLVGNLITGWDPSESVARVMGVGAFVVALAVGICLNLRDLRRDGRLRR